MFKLVKYQYSKNRSNQHKWLLYILIGSGLLVYIFSYSDWHPISKVVISIPVIVNLLFDLFYLRKVRYVIKEIHFHGSELVVLDTKGGKKNVSYSELKYSIRKRKFDKHKTEIELKIEKKFPFKTFARLPIKNWDSIFEIEKELEQRNIPRVEWQPMTLWRKYWGVFIDLIMVSAGGEDIRMTEYQEKSIKDVTQNPVKKEDPNE